MKSLCTLLFAAFAFTGRAAQLPAADRAAGITAPPACMTADAEAGTAAKGGMEALAAEVGALKARTERWGRIVDRLPRISGYIQLGYELSGESSTFFFKRVRLDLRGDIAPVLGYRIQLEFASSPKIVDAYLDYRPFRQLRLRLGEYKLPFSIENTEYVPLKFEFIEYPLALQQLMGFSERVGGRFVDGAMTGGELFKATGRDMGLSASGLLASRGDGGELLRCDVGVFNGSGINLRDHNRSKDVVARLMCTPVEGLLLAGSFYWGEYGASCLERLRYGAGVCYDRGPVMLRSEWIGGRTGCAPTEGLSGGTLRSSGWYAAGGWRATGSLMPVVRYDTLLADTAASASRQTNYTAGLVWQPVKYLRCQLNYTYEEYASGRFGNRNVVVVLFSGIF